MASQNIMEKHSSELLTLKIQQKKDWKQLLNDQQKHLAENKDIIGFAERFAQERDEHNRRYEKARKELLDRQQKELEESKKVKQAQRPKDEMEK